MHNGNLLKFIKRLVLAATLSALVPGLAGRAICGSLRGENERANQHVAEVRKLASTRSRRVVSPKYLLQPLVLFGAWISVLGFLAASPRKRNNYRLPVRG